jgi:type VI secretion system protein ImpJ
MTKPMVHWDEGMFLRPHHFQAAQRYQLDLSARGAKWDCHYNWGLRHIDLDLDALANYRLVVRSLQARMRDGTLVSAPEDGLLPALDLKAVLESETSVTVFLGVPQLYLGRANVGGNGGGSQARYLVESQNIEDENTGLNPQPVAVRLLNLKLLLSTDDATGYEVLPIAQLQRSAGVGAVPQLDETYIPPVLACEVWKPLGVGILQTLYDRMGKKSELLSSQVISRNLTFDSSSQGDRRIFEQLRILNVAYGALGAMFFAQGIHPLTAYVELCRLVGELAILGAQRRPPELPRYDHDDLGGCFYRVRQYIDALLDLVEEPNYKERPFIGTGLRMQVALESAWLEPTWRLFVGVQSPLSPEDCVNLLTRRLDMKIGSSDRVDDLFSRGAAGLKVTPVKLLPSVLPTPPGLLYFQVDREAQEQEWQRVQQSLSLAIRINENLVAGGIQGHRELQIKAAGQTTTIRFTLFVVPQEK